MPKVNTRFFICPACKQSNRFYEKVSAVFIYDEENPTEAGMMYQKDIEYECSNCKHIIKKETI